MSTTIKITVLSAVLFFAGAVYAAEAPDVAAYKDPVTGTEFVLIKGGCYEMGDVFADGGTDEKPAHKVCVDDFYLAKYSVTVGEFRKFVDATGHRTTVEEGDGCIYYTGKDFVTDKNRNWRKPGFPQDDTHPVVCVSWHDAVAFAKWMGKDGKTFRLPTEAEWEYAARSGGKREKWPGTSNPSELKDYAWVDNKDLSGVLTHPVGQKKPNGLGLYDMTGNALQWAADWYGQDYYSVSPVNNPKGPEAGNERIARGSSWWESPDACRTVYRNRNAPGYVTFGFGFRLARSK